MSDRKCDECGEPFGEDDDPRGCDFCDKVLCDDCIVYWIDKEIGDEGQCCIECTEDREDGESE